MAAESWSRSADARALLVAALVAVAVFARALLSAVAPGALATHGDEAVFVVRRLVLATGLALVFGAAFVRGLHGRWTRERLVGTATAEDLAVIRIALGLVTAGMLAFEPIPATRLLPAGLYEPVGFMALFEHIPLFTEARRDPFFLNVLWGTGIASCLAAAAGLFTRVTVPTGAVIALVCGGILRSYTRVFHLGLLPALLLLVLAFTPSGDALSVDARRGRAAATSPEAYAYGRFVILANVGIAYAAAGFSKLVRGGLSWWDARNMNRMLFESSLDPMMFDFDVPLHVRMPDWVVSSMGIFAILIELSIPLVLVRGLRGRFLLPLAAIGMHIGILLCQNILFPDVLALDLFLCAVLLKERAAAAQPDANVTVPRFVHWLVGAPLVIALAGIEAYPLTAWPMFSHADTSGIATYHRVYGVTSRGNVPLDVTRCFPSLHDTRHRDLMRWSIDGARSAPSREAFVQCAEQASRLQYRSSPIRHVVVERLRYDFVHARDDPHRGHVVARIVLPTRSSLFVALGSTP